MFFCFLMKKLEYSIKKCYKFKKMMKLNEAYKQL